MVSRRNSDRFHGENPEHRLAGVPGGAGSGGENLFSPRCSPDGRYIAGITTDSQALMLFDRTNQQWTELVRMSIGSPSWSHDGQYLYFDPTFTDIRHSSGCGFPITGWSA
jgi:hypothetical protein